MELNEAIDLEHSQEHKCSITSGSPYFGERSLAQYFCFVTSACWRAHVIYLRDTIPHGYPLALCPPFACKRAGTFFVSPLSLPTTARRVTYMLDTQEVFIVELGMDVYLKCVFILYSLGKKHTISSRLNSNSRTEKKCRSFCLSLFIFIILSYTFIFIPKLVFPFR